ncbi:MAG: GNAT family N-acetyltransferase [Spirochaetaceae bacterium]|jgi:GNAT superfamily N-acetyltransferase|nr:GNAT family N-acetyltransferase [Spirochaetaceae bacterium]
MNDTRSDRWWKAHEIEKIWPETLLKRQEIHCVAACSRFRSMNYIDDHAWVLSCGGEAASALILHSKRTIFPVFNGITNFYTPAFLLRALKSIDIYAIQGIKEETETMERVLCPLGFMAKQYVDFNMMVLDPAAELKLMQIPLKLKLRKPSPADEEKILPLQCAYEQEEVLPTGQMFDKRICRYNLAKIIKNEECLIAEINEKVVGKINTNAESFSFSQIGGVFVLPQYRGMGIATCLTAAMIRLLKSRGKAITLYVKKSNKPAISVYKKCGFVKLSDYRTVYIKSL